MGQMLNGEVKLVTKDREKTEVLCASFAPFLVLSAIEFPSFLSPVIEFVRMYEYLSRLEHGTEGVRTADPCH